MPTSAANMIAAHYGNVTNDSTVAHTDAESDPNLQLQPGAEAESEPVSEETQLHLEPKINVSFPQQHGSWWSKRIADCKHIQAMKRTADPLYDVVKYIIASTYHIVPPIGLKRALAMVEQAGIKDATAKTVKDMFVKVRADKDGDGGGGGDDGSEGELCTTTFEPELEPEREPELALDNYGTQEKEPVDDDVAAIFTQLGLAEYLGACHEEDIDIGAHHIIICIISVRKQRSHCARLHTVALGLCNVSDLEDIGLPSTAAAHVLDVFHQRRSHPDMARPDNACQPPPQMQQSDRQRHRNRSLQRPAPLQVPPQPQFAPSWLRLPEPELEPIDSPAARPSSPLVTFTMEELSWWL